MVGALPSVLALLQIKEVHLACEDHLGKRAIVFQTVCLGGRYVCVAPVCRCGVGASVWSVSLVRWSTGGIYSWRCGRGHVLVAL